MAEIPPLFSGLLVLPLLLLLAAAYVAPVASLLPQSLGETTVDVSRYVRLVQDPLFRVVLLRTFRIAGEVTLLVLLVGYPTGYLIWRSQPLAAAVLLALVLFPLWTSVLVRNYAWTALLARRGAVNEMLLAAGVIDEPLRLLNTELAVLIGMVHVLLPFAILPIYTALRRIDPAYLFAASSLGASATVTFRRVVLPMSLPGAAAAAVIVFVLALGFYVTPAVLGGPRSMMMANLIEQQMTYFLDFGQGAAMAVTLLGVSLLVLAVTYRSLDVDRLLREGT